MKYGLLMGMAVYCAAALAESSPTLTLTLLNVGEGQAVILHAKDEAILMDTGHAGQVQRVLAYMNNQGIRQLKAMILTHLHPDHASGYFRMREAFPDAPVLYNCHPLPADITPDMLRWVNEALQQDALRQCVAAGHEIRFHQARIRVLWPDTLSGTNLNHHSLVLHMDLPGRQVLLMGDADVQAEGQLVARNQLPPQTDVLIVGHHGAGDATSEAFLQRIKPALAVISVNPANIRGYPSPEVMQRLQALGIRVLRTDIQGDIKL